MSIDTQIATIDQHRKAKRQESGVTMAFGNYTLRSTPLDPYAEYFLENEIGEGMSVGAKELEMLLDQYFKENF